MALFLFVPKLGNAQAIPYDTTKTFGDTLETISPEDSILIYDGKGAIKGNTVVEDSTSKPAISAGKATIKEGEFSEKEDIGPVRKEETQPGIAKTKHPNRKTFYDPKIAVRRSLLLPGLGQVYNDRWWKVPIIYGGFAAFGVFIVQNHAEYNSWDKIVKCKDDSLACDVYPGYDMATVISFREYHRRYRDLNVIFATLWYTMNAVEAYIDAHLKGFNVSDDLSLHVNPNLSIDPFRQRSLYMGASISLRLRK